MRMNICTLPRMRTVIKILCAAFVLTLLCPPASAQNRPVSTRTAQAELHIRATVVPVVLHPRHHEREDRDDKEVMYNLAPQAERLSIKAEERSMLVDIAGQSERAEQVRLTTVVAK